MGADTRDQRVVRELKAALATDDPREKNFHIRQALQFISVG